MWVYGVNVEIDDSNLYVNGLQTGVLQNDGGHVSAVLDSCTPRPIDIPHLNNPALLSAYRSRDGGREPLQKPFHYPATQGSDTILLFFVFKGPYMYIHPIFGK